MNAKQTIMAQLRAHPETESQDFEKFSIEQCRLLMASTKDPVARGLLAQLARELRGDGNMFAVS
jgi:hypothetical protein